MKYDFFKSEVAGTLTLIGDENGLRHIEFPKELNRISIRAEWKRDPAFFAPITDQLRAYFSGELVQFTVLLAPQGTPFQLRVWDALKEIPYGKLVTYKEIAEKIGNPKAVRAVGAANGKNPIPIIIPCHRVIGSDGLLTGFGGGLPLKQRLIALENPEMVFN